MDLEILLSPLQSILDTFQSKKHYQNKNVDSTLLSIKKALLETKKYIETSNETRDRNKEYELSELWVEASIKAKRAKMDWIILDKKSKYWEDSNIWSKKRVLDNGIDIPSMEKQIDILLKNS